MQEMQVQSLGQEVPLEKEIAIRSSILAWKILWTEEPGRLQSTGLQKAGQDGVRTQACIPLILASYCASTPPVFPFPLTHWNSTANYCMNSHTHSDFHCPSFPKLYFCIKLQHRLNLSHFLLSLNLCGICSWEKEAQQYELADLILNSQPSAPNEFFVLVSYYIFLIKSSSSLLWLFHTFSFLLKPSFTATLIRASINPLLDYHHSDLLSGFSAVASDSTTSSPFRPQRGLLRT